MFLQPQRGYEPPHDPIRDESFLKQALKELLRRLPREVEDSHGEITNRLIYTILTVMVNSAERPVAAIKIWNEWENVLEYVLFYEGEVPIYSSLLRDSQISESPYGFTSKEFRVSGLLSCVIGVLRWSIFPGRRTRSLMVLTDPI